MRIQPDRLKPILRVEFSFIACVISVLLFTPHVWGQTPEKDKTEPQTDTPPKFHATIEIGGQVRDGQGGHTAKFQEVRDVPKGFVIPLLKLDYNTADSPYFLAFRGTEIRERDQRFTADGGRFGKYRTQFMWDQVPHSFGSGQSFLEQTAPGVYQVSPTLRARLQALTTPEARISPTAELPRVVRQELQTRPIVDVRLRRDQALFRQSYQPADNVELHAQVSWMRNRGSRPMSAGTFVRRAAPGNGLTDIGGAWEGIGQEFLEPLDQRTIDLKLGAHFSGKRWNAGADYDLSLFRNHVESVIFENPFRITDEEGCLPNPANPLAPTCGASNRFRMVRWQNDLAPNNDSHTFSFWANVDLTPRTQLRGLFSLAYWTQNDAFLPWTLNTAIVPRHWDGNSPITNPTDVNQLPAKSLNGKMRNITQEYALVNRREKFRFQAEYRSQSLDNQSPMLEFPGYAAFGDSTWRSAVTDFYNLPIENLDWDFRRQDFTFGFQWDVLPQLTWKMDYEGEIWNRKFRDVNRNNEHSIRARLDFTANLSGAGKTNGAGKDPVPAASQAVAPPTLTTLNLRLDYRYSNRSAQAYNTQPLSFNGALSGSPPGGNTTGWEITRTTVMRIGVPMEFNLLRRFDEADRIRNDGSVWLELLRGPRTNFSASYRCLGEEYDKNSYGRNFNRFSFFDAQFTHSLEDGTSFFASYSRETNQIAYRDLAHLLPNPPAPPGTIVQGTLSQYPIANTWERTSRSSLNSFEIGLSAAPQEGKLRKFQFDLSYALSFARDRISTVNPFTVRPDSVLHAGANPYPDTVVRRQDVNITISRAINERLEIGVRYLYEP
ncbi:MAG: MtrB/PioB family outer membrane beta-barrel protein [Blastocatellia bacterium]|nr:MtrB/PioB family outer membrane beta-barrel protein [Blastocatellia bacterium]